MHLYITILLALCLFLFLMIPGNLYAQEAELEHAYEHARVFEVPDPYITDDELQQPVPLNYTNISESMYSVAEKGTVEVLVLVDELGAYMGHLITESSTKLHSDVVASRLEDLWFEPATRQGRPVVGWASLQFQF